MASPQVENGAIVIALDLFVAISRYDMTGLERRVLDAVIYCTYGNRQTKAEITVEDIRYLLGADNKLRTDRIQAALNKLVTEGVIFRQVLVNGKQILGVQKDYDRWSKNGDKMSDLITKSLLEINNKTYEVSSDKMSPDEKPTPVKLLEYAMSKNQFKYSLGSYKAELKQAKRLYLEVLGREKSGVEAYNLITDFIDTNEWMQQNVKMVFTYANNCFFQWRSQVPRKPREIRENEEATGRRYRFNVKNKQWEAVATSSTARLGGVEPPKKLGGVQ